MKSTTQFGPHFPGPAESGSQTVQMTGCLGHLRFAKEGASDQGNNAGRPPFDTTPLPTQRQEQAVEDDRNKVPLPERLPLRHFRRMKGAVGNHVNQNKNKTGFKTRKNLPRSTTDIFNFPRLFALKVIFRLFL